ncbi:putative sterile alpha motif/pointed domain-containing protein [Heracleum sosnowskyi]|uniref:Sterile alpha motif/pointed domain-containing protein n=1 Tax=Heracleum sosnowskyi TaxID=360622 RepID=A0AAD8HZU2_9APIA|nr:putative sterile alpha motif/pointed domain-containing protein [Heracleum sosnowskyi]
MTELQPPDGQINGDTSALVVASTDNVGTKRQRRPSVRLGDIGGDQSHDSHLNLRRSNKWKLPYKSNSSSKTRPLLNLSGSEFEKEDNLDCVAIGSWKVRDSKSKRRNTKRIRSNWVSKGDESGGEDGEGFRDFGDSDSPVKGNSGVNSLDNLGNWGNCNGERNGVRVWLNQLGLGRYAPVFEIHEVDDEVLPMLTLEDLKDMGINAVGSRRKMFCSIQKLGKSFS